MPKRKYAATQEELEKKLARVMERLGVEKYSYDWQQARGGASCYVEMLYGASVYRFENSSEKSRESGRDLVFVMDLFAAVVYALEGLARAVEQDIFTLDMLLKGVPSLPAAQEPPLEGCFRQLGFDHRPRDAEEVKERYKQLAKGRHPDGGGTALAFQLLSENYQLCLEKMKEGSE